MSGFQSTAVLDHSVDFMLPVGNESQFSEPSPADLSIANLYAVYLLPTNSRSSSQGENSEVSMRYTLGIESNGGFNPLGSALVVRPACRLSFTVLGGIERDHDPIALLT
jgi:hypothetical protein